VRSGRRSAMTTHKSLYDPTEATGAVDACKIGRRTDLPFPRVNADIVLAVEPPSRVTCSASELIPKYSTVQYSDGQI
jgi:hypothetical protein